MKEVRNAIPYVTLSEADIYGKGSHKKCYRMPDRGELCIKLPYNDGGVKDLSREIRYIHVMRRQHRESPLLPEYYGVVQTNYGEGHVYERITNADGSECRTLAETLVDLKLLEEDFDGIVALLRRMHDELLRKGIITMGLYPENILFQKTKDGRCRVRLVNDMGSKTLIPLEYFSEHFAHRRVVKRWKEFLHTIVSKYPSDMAEKLVKEIA
ncbi:MAG: YrbL family protein [Succiniclasticum sp.]|jgi:hypothetical protein